MFELKEKLTFININQDYLKYLHDSCQEVYFKPIGYENKPYLGILINKEKNQYVIPLSSAKEKHKAWKNIETDRFLIYENCEKSVLSKNAVYKDNPDGTVKHILSVIDLKKMIPIKEGLYTKVDLSAKIGDSIGEINYKNLLNKEFSFCLKILPAIIHKANKIYSKQIDTNKVSKFCCDFKLLEEKCKAYEVKSV
ncbi:type III toxin-antitoxin system ToxN/AbiQ family toxin [Treponema zioleckii]|uniref:type III toxin-antitoxin system ToxN/AbiQ family toxin n=1 Tax=Treponema zioleckii TaxID=331680 RepID=UPI00168B26A8|nr:type III toxin-antitoxin system ToxN/AbiQ family toxin [Treponema zioleckii]